MSSGLTVGGCVVLVLVIGLFTADARRKRIERELLEESEIALLASPSPELAGTPEAIAHQVVSDAASLGQGANGDYRVRLRMREGHWVLELGTSVQRVATLEEARARIIDHARTLLVVMSA